MRLRRVNTNMRMLKNQTPPGPKRHLDGHGTVGRSEFPPWSQHLWVRRAAAPGCGPALPCATDLLCDTGQVICLNRHHSIACEMEMSVISQGFFFGHAHGRRKFPGQGSDTIHGGDNAESLTPGLPGNSMPRDFVASQADTYDEPSHRPWVFCLGQNVWCTCPAMKTAVTVGQVQELGD